MEGEKSKERQALDALERRLALHAFGQKVMQASPRELGEMCESWGVKPPTNWEAADYQMGEVVAMSAAEFAQGAGASQRNMAEFVGALGRAHTLNESFDLEALPDGEIGSPGTLVAGGIIRADPSGKLNPYKARGSSGSHGVYDQHLLDPLVYKTVASIKELLVTGVWEMHVPEGLEGTDRERCKEAADVVWRALQNVRDGWDHYVEHAALACYRGNAPFEVVWKERHGHMLPERLGARETSTVHQWMFDPAYRELAGASFLTGGSGVGGYALPAYGPRTQDHRMFVVHVGGSHLNVEGLPANRTIDTILAKKRLLMTIEAASAERYGSPLLLVEMAADQVQAMAALAESSPRASGHESDDNEDGFFDSLATFRALDTAVIQTPAGITARFLSPGGDRPVFTGELQYLDTQAMLAWSNQGALLSQFNGGGSYALAQVSDNDFLRSGPYYARRVVEPINRLVRMILEREFGLVDLPAYPVVRWRTGETTNVSMWLGDLRTLLEMRDRLTPTLEAAALERMELPPDALQEVAEDVDGDGVADDGSASNVSEELLEAMRTGLRAQMSQGEAELDTLRGGDLEELMDDAQLRLASRLARLNRAMRAAWREEIRDNTDPSDFAADADRIRARFLAEAREAVREVIEWVQERAADLLLDALEVTRLGFAPEVDGDLGLLMESAAQEAINRMIGEMTDGEAERERGATAQAVGVLAVSTLSGIAAKVVSSAVVRARTVVVEGLMNLGDALGVELGAAYATRTSVLDSGTCGPCRELDGTRVRVGTKRYRELTPPSKCLGRARCRCMWDYELPLDKLMESGLIGLHSEAEAEALADL